MQELTGFSLRQHSFQLIREFLMRHGLSILALGLTLATAWAHAADPAPADKTPQQSKMAMCNKEAEGKKGDERKAFMKECLSANKKETQQNKMKTCNAEAKESGKKGDERKMFMSECLKAK
jgi:psiF repeat